eukprot:6190808-Pleurochrysis_carterae.AAC.3
MWAATSAEGAGISLSPGMYCQGGKEGIGMRLESHLLRVVHGVHGAQAGVPALDEGRVQLLFGAPGPTLPRALARALARTNALAFSQTLAYALALALARTNTIANALALAIGHRAVPLVLLLRRLFRSRVAPARARPAAFSLVRTQDDAPALFRFCRRTRGLHRRRGRGRACALYSAVRLFTNSVTVMRCGHRGGRVRGCGCYDGTG